VVDCCAERPREMAFPRGGGERFGRLEVHVLAGREVPANAGHLVTEERCLVGQEGLTAARVIGKDHRSRPRDVEVVRQSGEDDIV
jgi:hypothetical protein